MALFSRTKQKDVGKTFLLIDIENGSAATGLVHLSAGEGPKLFGEKRVHAPLVTAVHAAALARSLDRALEEALVHTSEAAAYLRGHEETAHAGELAGALVFLHAPWSSFTRSGDSLRWEFDQELIQLLEHRIAARIHPGITTYHPFGRAAAHGAQYISDEPVLVANMTGELMELLLAEGGSIRGRATMPVGHRTVLRTLMSHGNMTAPEAESALGVTHLHTEHPFIEPLEASAKHYAALFNEVARELLPAQQVPHLLVIGSHRASDWLARALTKHIDHDLFTPTGTVRVLKARNLEPHVIVHPSTHDVPLMLETLFVHNAQHRI